MNAYEVYRENRRTGERRIYERREGIGRRVFIDAPAEYFDVRTGIERRDVDRRGMERRFIPY